MADIRRRRPQNAAGPFYVDSSCIDCDACRSMAPGFYSDIGDQSAVTRQPVTEAERLEVYQALLTCPTASIGCTDRPTPDFVKRAASGFPLSVAGEVFFCGYAAESSFGATAWFVRREDGNVMVDSPRFAAPLVQRIRELGGIRWLFLTHQDDVADHAKWAREFGCTRILHEADVHGHTRDVEMQLKGQEAVRLAQDLTVIPTPGHTRGSCVLHFAGAQERFLFGGDHVAILRRAATSMPFAPPAGTPGPRSCARWRSCGAGTSTGCCPATAGAFTAASRRHGIPSNAASPGPRTPEVSAACS